MEHNPHLFFPDGRIPSTDEERAFAAEQCMRSEAFTHAEALIRRISDTYIQAELRNLLSNTRTAQTVRSATGANFYTGKSRRRTSRSSKSISS